MGKNPSRHRGNPDLPVDQVSWFDCQEFCERLCQQYGQVFRLPSEAEWEYACRAGTKTKFAFGDTISPSQANFTPHSIGFGHVPTEEKAFMREMELGAQADETTADRNAKPTPVGSYPANAWGICDMHGNVDEWCEDVWHPNYEGAAGRRQRLARRRGQRAFPGHARGLGFGHRVRLHKFCAASVPGRCRIT